MSDGLHDVAGLKVGQARADAPATGVTVVVGEKPMTAGVHVMGGAPGTRETDLLRPGASVDAVDALVLSGGSAFGLAAADGAMRALAAEGRGYPAGDVRVPIVPAAILFDLGGDIPAPGLHARLGAEAVRGRGGAVAEGSVGAGAGATVAELAGGVGTASARLPSGAVVAALVAVNALGRVTADHAGRFWAAPFERGEEFGGRGIATAPDTSVSVKGGAATVIAVVATDLRLDKAQATRMAIAAHDGIARAVFPAHTPMDGDLVFACATGRRAAAEGDLALLGHEAALCLSRAIARGVFHAAPGGRHPAWSERYG